VRVLFILFCAMNGLGFMQNGVFKEVNDGNNSC